MSVHGRTDKRTEGNASKTVYPPVSLCSLGGYKYVNTMWYSILKLNKCLYKHSSW